MAADRRRRARANLDTVNEPGKPFELRARQLYDDRGKLRPLDDGIVNAQQVRAMQRQVRAGRAEGRITVTDATAELAMLTAMRKRLNEPDSPRQVVAQFVAENREFRIRKKVTEAHRKLRRSERESRKAARPAKKSKSRKRRG